MPQLSVVVYFLLSSYTSC